MNLEQQTAARLDRAGITWNDPAIARLATWNALMRDLHKAAEKCGWPSCPVPGHRRPGVTR